MTPQQQEQLRELPAVGILLENERVRGWIEETSRPAVGAALQDAVDQLRQGIREAQYPVQID